MGRSVKPTYVVHYADQLGVHRVAWNVKTGGIPTDKSLEAWRVKMNASMKMGGCNFHISQHAGILVHVHEAIVVNQKTGDRNVAFTQMPKFEEV